ncbi:retropepsin-like domain-containing protein [Paenibacillus athensensis]|uniref:Peptidase A2 domain-containing protein n=1 Tax=Paenibacillus athensensis TaxID=1967502 RepID=A0A4Y8Q0S7_9BACL|nr:retropepsin-like aspartic protease [Paenibacillus athensensis]MCD1258541.1 retropepsin-like domain-containing protein [Paenibacillus athensensis]
MNIDLKYGLPFIEVTICYRGEELLLKNVLLDTGSAGTIFSADAVDAVGVKIEPGDFLNKIRGVGGVEVVYSKHFDFVKAGEVSLSAFEVEIGDMNYGMEIDGILGFDFIRSSGLVIDSRELTVLAKD